MAKSPYIKGIGQLVLDRYLAQDHFEGLQFRHKASHVDIDVAPLLIDGYPLYTVEDAILNMAEIINSGIAGGYSRIELNNSAPFNKRNILNFIGSAISITDNVSNNSTDVTINPGYSIIQENGSPAPAESKLNFINHVILTDNQANNSTDVDIDNGYNTVFGPFGPSGPQPLTARHNLSFSSDFIVADNPSTLSTDVSLVPISAGITQLTGDVLASGSGSVNSTVVQLTGNAGIVDVLATTTRLSNNSSITYYDTGSSTDVNIVNFVDYGASNYDNTFGSLPSNIHVVGKLIDFSIGTLSSIHCADISTDENNLISFNIGVGLKTHGNTIYGDYVVDSDGNYDLRLDYNLSAPATLTLPPCTPGRVIIIADEFNNFDQYPLTLQPINGNTIRLLPNAFITKKGYVGFLIGDVFGNNWSLSHGENDTSTSRYQMQFDSGFLLDGYLNVNHNLNQFFVHVTVYDQDNVVIFPDQIRMISNNSCVLNLTAFIDQLAASPLPWTVLVST